MLHSKQANESIAFPDQEFGTYRKMVFPLEGKKFNVNRNLMTCHYKYKTGISILNRMNMQLYIIGLV